MSSSSDFDFGIPLGEAVLNVSLLQLAVTPRTRKLYYNAAADFIAWYRNKPGACSSYVHIDVHLAVYLDTLFRSGISHLGHANNTVFGLIHLAPFLKPWLPVTRRALKGWKKSRVVLSWPPLVWELCCMLAIQLSSVGWYDEAFALLVGYDGYLRISELLSCRVRDFHEWILAEPPQYQLRLKFTKTGPNRLVTLTRPGLGAMLGSYIRTRHAGKSSQTRIFGFSPQQFRKRFRIGCELLGWESVGFVPHSLRHGHASDAFNDGVPVETIQVQGRWASIESTRRYIQSARVHLIRGRLTPILPVLPDYGVQAVVSLMQETFLNSLPQ
jgi:hypothetical protein